MNTKEPVNANIYSRAVLSHVSEIAVPFELVWPLLLKYKDPTSGIHVRYQILLAYPADTQCLNNIDSTSNVNSILLNAVKTSLGLRSCHWRGAV